MAKAKQTPPIPPTPPVAEDEKDPLQEIYDLVDGKWFESKTKKETVTNEPSDETDEQPASTQSPSININLGDLFRKRKPTKRTEPPTPTEGTGKTPSESGGTGS